MGLNAFNYKDAYIEISNEMQMTDIKNLIRIAKY